MRTIASLASLIALGLIAGGVLTIASSGGHDGSAFALGAPESGSAFDLRSMLVGLCLGILLSNLARVPWLELPRRAVVWVLDHERNLYRAAIALLLIGILIYY